MTMTSSRPRRRPRSVSSGLVLLAAVLALVCPAASGSADAATVTSTVSSAVSSGAETDPVGVWPLHPQPEVLRTFDPPDSPYGAGHRGVDLLGRVGQTVHAALPGTVTFAGSLAGRGVVVVDHGATRTTYEPVSATVAVGDRVPAGGRLGTLQLAGSHCFPRACLHWGWLRGEVYLDPLRLVGAGPVRLLPLWRDQPVSRGEAPAASARPLAPAYAAVLPLLGVVPRQSGRSERPRAADETG